MAHSVTVTSSHTARALPMAKRRMSQIELNFDSMTDLITNLAGGLILLVLLLLGVTREAVSQSKPAPPPAPAEEEPQEAGDRSAKALRQRINDLQIELKSIESSLQRLDEP